MRKSELKKISEKFQICKEVIRSVEKRFGLEPNEIEKLLHNYRRFIMMIGNHRREKRIFNVEVFAETFVRCKRDFTIFRKFLLFLIQKRTCIIREARENNSTSYSNGVVRLALKKFFINSSEATNKEVEAAVKMFVLYGKRR